MRWVLSAYLDLIETIKSTQGTIPVWQHYHHWEWSILMNVCNIFWCRHYMWDSVCPGSQMTHCTPRMSLLWLYSGMLNVLYCAAFEVDVRLIYWILMTGHSLVVEDNVRSPDVISRHVETLDPPVLLWVPLQLVVAPVLLHPQVGRHDLVLEVLKTTGIKICFYSQCCIIILVYFVVNWN